MDLSSLNTAEREVLTLLSQGHTAKSIAVLTGRSEGAVNERLREARRKTGVGSSRELARLHAAQENRDELIGVAADDGVGAAPGPEAAAGPAGGRSKGIALMAMLATGAAALILLFQPVAPQTAPSPQDDPLLGGVLQQGPPPADLYGQLRAQTRDTAWAPPAEAALRRRYAQISGIDELRVSCGAKLCEVAGIIPHGPQPKVDATMQALQGMVLVDDVRKLGFADILVTGFTSKGEGGTKDRTMVFYSYLSRAGG